MAVDLSSIAPFEICSIRPPTENASLTFRLTRNCYWNKCRFCPVYKLGAKFSRRTLDTIEEDIRRAKLIDDLLYENGIGDPLFSGFMDGQIADLVNRVEKAHIRTPDKDASHNEANRQPEETLDPRLAWFLSWFKDKPSISDSIHHVAAWRTHGTGNCFLGDADSLILKPGFMKRILEKIRMNFPDIRRFTVYGRTASAARLRKLKELIGYRKAGLDRVHFGLESGSDSVLKLMNKGVTGNDHVEAGIKTRAAGLSCSVYIMPGLGGAALSEEHAYDTASVISRMKPDYVRIRSLELFPGTPLEDDRRGKRFAEQSEQGVVKEIKIIIENITSSTEIVSDSASNLLQINGRLPEDRASMLSSINAYLDLPRHEQLVFSARSRLSAFFGQYGGLTEDIHKALQPFLWNEQIDFSHASEHDLSKLIRLIRSKLMP